MRMRTPRTEIQDSDGCRSRACTKLRRKTRRKSKFLIASSGRASDKTAPTAQTAQLRHSYGNTVVCSRRSPASPARDAQLGHGLIPVRFRFRFHFFENTGFGYGFGSRLFYIPVTVSVLFRFNNGYGFGSVMVTIFVVLYIHVPLHCQSEPKP
jgi:hypothetical protein